MQIPRPSNPERSERGAGSELFFGYMTARCAPRALNGDAGRDIPLSWPVGLPTRSPPFQGGVPGVAPGRAATFPAREVFAEARLVANEQDRAHLPGRAPLSCVGPPGYNLVTRPMRTFTDEHGAVRKVCNMDAEMIEWRLAIIRACRRLSRSRKCGALQATSLLMWRSAIRRNVSLTSWASSGRSDSKRLAASAS